MEKFISRQEALKRIKELEKKREFDQHVDPYDPDGFYKVDEKFPYIKKGFKKIFYGILNLFIVKPFTKKINKDYNTTFIGRENLEGISNGVVICNHVNIFDCLVCKQGFKGKNLNIVSAEFNNRKDRLGTYMRAGGIMPLSDNHGAMRNFNKAFEIRMKKRNSFILIYPEQAMWWNYKKVRPFKNGAFHYASKYNVPIIPTFITFKERNEKDSEGINLRDFYYNILKPIYPKKELSNKENIEYLKNESFNAIKDCYESFYGKKLNYDED